MPPNKLAQLLTLQRQNDIISLLLEGKDDKEIKNYIIRKYQAPAPSATVYVSLAKASIKERKLYEVPVLVPLHIQRYEEIYEKLYSLGAHGVAMLALKAKEKLLNFHKDNFHMRVNSGEISQVGIMNVQAQYEPMRLGSKKARFNELMTKAKG